MKRLLDLAGAAAALLLLCPLLLLVAVAVLLDSGPPVLFRQARVGRHGRIFKLVKFRTMKVDPRGPGPILTEWADPRITACGRILRRYKLDELPQLVNVVRGDMSLVGPRPELPELVAYYSDEERRVLSVRPGITGPTQLAAHDEEEHLPAGVDIVRYHVEKILRPKLRSDLAYVAERSTWGDLVLLGRTLLALWPWHHRPPASAVSGKGAKR
jgi:lipopolysaccharide/colanic/teichoic acid biosynthesis glycosyltransferase